MEENKNAAQDANAGKQEEQNEEDYKSKYMYLLAEVDNYKKSKEKELVEYMKYSNERLVIDLLKVLDDFESVLKQDKDEKVQALYKALVSVLSYYGLEMMEVLGKDFSSDIAEVVATEESKEEKGKIIEEVQKGYKLNGKIIRYPKVKISV
ncbi:nucleotide exchange factor GrpE [Candidatus Parvarchaeota archaeon]|nr:nucleotide exchange factor GrpE [Candidatus Parvarchaeota archaeon]